MLRQRIDLRDAAKTGRLIREIVREVNVFAAEVGRIVR